MDILIVLTSAFIVGLVMSAPVGPMGAIAVLQTANKKISSAFTLALGVCLADICLALIALQAVRNVNFKFEPSNTSAIILAIIMLALGCYFWLNANKKTILKSKKASFTIGFISTIVHPGNIVSFIAVFKLIETNMQLTLSTVPMLVGIFLGALFGWFILIAICIKFTNKAYSAQSIIKKLIAIICWIVAAITIAGMFY